MKRSLWTWDEDKQLKALAGTVPARVIAERLGRPINGVHHRIKKLKLCGRLSGEYHWAARLSGIQAEMIGVLKDAGFSGQEIKRAFNLPVNGKSIDDIGACRTWKN